MTLYHAQLNLPLAALADPTRRGMVERLAHGPAAVSELAEPFNMALPTILQHIKVLEASGLVRSKKTGRVRICDIEGAALREVQSWLAAQVQLWESRLDRLDTLAMRLAKEQE